MIYVLIVVALFAALSFILARQSDTGEQGILDEEEIQVRATQIVQVSNQVKQGIDQMLWSGMSITAPGNSNIDELDFTQPGEAGFGTTAINQAFHPEGGGLVMPTLPKGAINEVDTNPAPGWYIGRFNNVEWTQTAADDVILTAHQISQPVCAEINNLITGSTVIPALSGAINRTLIDAATHTNGPNNNLDTATCAGCDGYAALCVQDSGGTMYSYYNIVAQQ